MWKTIYYIGKCLDSVNVLAGDTRDSLNRSRFLPFVPQDHLFLTDVRFWYHDYSFYEIKTVIYKYLLLQNYNYFLIFSAIYSFTIQYIYLF